MNLYREDRGAKSFWCAVDVAVIT